MKLILKTALTVSITLTLSALPNYSFAQDDQKSTTNGSLAPLFQCAMISSDAERLSCQDTEIQKLQSATEAKKLVVIDQKSVKEIKKKSFGLSFPKLGLLDSGDASDEPKDVVLLVKSVDVSRRKLTIVMQDGQIWQSVDSNFGYFPKKGKIEARIKSAAFGSFLMKLSSEKARSKMIRVRRIE